MGAVLRTLQDVRSTSFLSWICAVQTLPNLSQTTGWDLHDLGHNRSHLLGEEPQNKYLVCIPLVAYVDHLDAKVWSYEDGVGRETTVSGAVSVHRFHRP